MLMDLKRPLKAGERVPLELRIETRDKRLVTQPIEVVTCAAAAPRRAQALARSFADAHKQLASEVSRPSPCPRKFAQLRVTAGTQRSRPGVRRLITSPTAQAKNGRRPFTPH